MSAVFLPPHAARQLPTRHLGRPLLVFPQLDSTNALALTLATDPARHGLALLAEEQTAGRGQHGRAWHAPARSSVLLSLLLFTPPALRRPALLVAWAAVSVCELIHACTELDATIKWPNDVLVRGKKVCGILIEQRNSGDPDRPLATVVGIGLNVTQPATAFADAELPHAGSLLSMSSRLLDTENVACRLLLQLDAEYDRLLHGDYAPLARRWQDRLGLVGRRVRIEGAREELCGQLLALTLDGLEVQIDAGTVTRVPPEAVRHIEMV
jgi:BirA family transcriptional regulator, biotin operon repressor / biotin---[acetyl-CoA-carboxylase] ligase